MTAETSKRTRQIGSLLARLLAQCFAGHSAQAFQPPEHAKLPDLDLRRSVAPQFSRPSAAQEAARQRLLNGVAWTRIWANGLQAMDRAWTKQHINLAALADNQPAVQLRWSDRILRTGASPMSDWNIDDVEILADSAMPRVSPLLGVALTAANNLQLTWLTNAAGLVATKFRPRHSQLGHDGRAARSYRGQLSSSPAASGRERLLPSGPPLNNL